MPKFNVGMIRGANTEPEQEKVAENKIKVGAGLMSDVSKNAVKMKITHISRSELDKNENNMYDIGNIESLAWSIKTMGLLQPLHVTQKEDGRYILLGGERRLTAIDSLIADPECTDWNEDSMIPVVVKKYDEVDLPLDDELKETLSIITTNKEAREYTDKDRLEELNAWEKIIDALRKEGVEKLPYTDAEGNEIRIKGEKTRDIISKTTGMSKGLINSFNKVKNQGSDSVNELLFNNEISVGTANELIEQAETEEGQDRIVNKLKKEGKELTANNIKEAINQERTEEIDLVMLKSDLADVVSALEEQEVMLSVNELKTYNKAIKTLNKLLVRK